jgi:excisionase family DNA binding protein
MLSRGQVAEILGVSNRTVARWTKRGVLPHVRLGRRVIRYRERDLDSLVEKRTVRGTETTLNS